MVLGRRLAHSKDQSGRAKICKGVVTGGRGSLARRGKKDLMSAGMYCYLAFRLWLRAGEWVPGIKTENRALFSMQ